MAVEPDTEIEAPTRPAREYPSLPSQGPPVEIFCRPIRFLLHGNAASGVDILPCQPPCLLTDDERPCISNVFGETKPLQWRHLDTGPTELVSHHACLSKTLR